MFSKLNNSKSIFIIFLFLWKLNIYEKFKQKVFDKKQKFRNNIQAIKKIKKTINSKPNY